MKVCPHCHLEYHDDHDVCVMDGTKLEAASDPRIGKLVLGRYVIDGQLGTGGMATVYRAHESTTGRSVAVKVMHANLARDRDLRERFRREARIAAALVHENIVEIFDAGETEDHEPVIVMALLVGHTLREVIAKGPMPLGLVVALGVQIARALARARPRRGAPRSQARERVRRRRGREADGEARRLRHRARAPRVAPHGGRHDGRHARIPRARAHQGPRERPLLGSLLVRHRAPRDDHRAAAVPVHFAAGLRDRAPRHATSVTGGHGAELPQAARVARPAPAREGPLRSPGRCALGRARTRDHPLPGRPGARAPRQRPTRTAAPGPCLAGGDPRALGAPRAPARADAPARVPSRRCTAGARPYARRSPGRGHGARVSSQEAPRRSADVDDVDASAREARERLGHAVHELGVDLSKAREEFARLRAELDARDAQVKDLEFQIDVLRKKLEETQSDADTHRASARSELSSSGSRIEALQRAIGQHSRLLLGALRDHPDNRELVEELERA